MLKIVISGVNLVEGGILRVLKDVLQALRPLKTTLGLEVIVLVHKRNLVAEYLDDYQIIEYPEIKTAWRKRIKFEYITSNQLSKQLKPDLWIALHDMTPTVTCPMQVVYCHNASPFYKTDLSKFFYDTTFSLFTLFYKYLYRINIKKNAFVIVQQEWLRQKFRELYGVNAIVASPVSKGGIIAENKNLLAALPVNFDRPVFFYPTFPRVFKNIEALCRAAEMLQQTISDFELVITMDGQENAYARKVVDRFRHISQIRFIGLQSRKTVEALYYEADSLVFPSKLETWGLPVSEFMQYNKPILIADLPYAHETIGSYQKAKFFAPDDEQQLAEYMAAIINKTLVFDINQPVTPAWPYFTCWDDLLQFLLTEANAKKNNTPPLSAL
ncbi:glycosyltransferase family 1 protein [Mucilaginibacter gynuensis]|uniref:Glycosyltransferase family 1 protein n=1 Tax=Mucilaginibacter gynuensis TaxID=1302236 RepID=A0ABP8GMU0_9SPHI